jgi:hypothetical protein
MQRAILFRFHNHLRVCRNHVQLLATFNPGTPIFGVFGGPERLFPLLRHWTRAIFGSAVTNLYCISGQSRQWKWANSDLVVRLWYRDVGRQYPFDVLHVVEWDLALFAPLAEAYARVPPDGVGLTGLTPLAAVEDRWGWTAEEPHRTEWRELLEFARTRLGYDLAPYACIGPGVCFPRAFLERYLDIDLPPLCHDELRLPLLAQILGFRLYDTGFFRRWFDADETRFFNADTVAVDSAVMKDELSKPSGRRAFHPSRDLVRASWLKHKGAASGGDQRRAGVEPMI